MKQKLNFFFKRAIILSSIQILITTLFTGCGANPKNFTFEDMTITLTDDFVVEEAPGFKIYLESDDVLFSAIEEDFDSLEHSGYEIDSLNDYCIEILQLNNASSETLTQREDYYYFTNTGTVSGANYTYVHCMMKGNSSYWVCEFVCKTKHYKRLKDKIFNWADSIEIK